MELNIRIHFLKLRSSIKPELLRYTLRKGTFSAGIGLFLLLFAGIFIPVNRLETFGFIIVFLSTLLITFGLYPYQKLKKIELNPYEIIFLKDTILFSTKKKTEIIIPFTEIDRVIYIQTPYRYGIGLILKKPMYSKLHDYDLFLPYFSSYSFKQFEEALFQID